MRAPAVDLFGEKALPSVTEHHLEAHGALGGRLDTTRLMPTPALAEISALPCENSAVPWLWLVCTIRRHSTVTTGRSAPAPAHKFLQFFSSLFPRPRVVHHPLRSNTCPILVSGRTQHALFNFHSVALDPGSLCLAPFPASLPTHSVPHPWLNLCGPFLPVLPTVLLPTPGMHFPIHV